MVADAIGDVLAFCISVGSHQVETALEVLAQLTSHAVVVTVIRSIGDVIRIDFATNAVGNVLVNPSPSLFRFARQLDIVTAFEAESSGSNSGDVLVVDAFQSGFHAAGKFSIEAQRALPGLRHLQVLVHDGGRRRSSQVSGQILGAKQCSMVGDDLVQIGVEMNVGVFGGRIDVLILHAVGVTHSRDDPHERNTAGVEAGTTTDDILTFASEVPVEAQTR